MLALDTLAVALPLAALILAAGGFLVSIVVNRNAVSREYVKGLETALAVVNERVGHAEVRLERCEKARDDLADENIRLMRRVLGIE